MWFSAAIAVASGGALGALSRFGTVFLSQTLLKTRFPVGTLLVNCLGSFLIGLLMHLFLERYADQAHWRLFWVVGFLGAYTTFSSYAWETWVLYENGQWLGAVLNIMLNNCMTLLLVLIGIQSGRWLGGV
ncbi:MULTISPECIES: fluoride efflux transporter CrcB [Legionella]|uniref:Fluoride-specific ion channel FluC n=1 Tax=Legionella septentrionalis TaxID=2498109 RepID=A0A433JJ50_9GAMM|nr:MULTISPECIES: fluoride efflux transporter CrcB [Legionella]MCP0913170.1 fluoride efflux transporter CrcB [Legionella sp. 27cVA30]RUQ88067.1 fluoride efflux transporter CrcB [Legionella septentrionalis]RUR02446.1 fluoride efflux transporter CrcB [Legionella septentrionalis]RUR09303.1 fluoride efflux transporter CrcB [Legionella septentrionalis]RUR17104.1 fluoride efflux transporter CrcB [Legionella septentrionalis]